MTFWELFYYIIISGLVIYFGKMLYRFGTSSSDGEANAADASTKVHERDPGYAQLRTMENVPADASLSAPSNPDGTTALIPGPGPGQDGGRPVQPLPLPPLPQQQQQPTPQRGQGAIPTSVPSRYAGGNPQGLTGAFSNILGDEAEFEPVQHMPTPIPNDRMMPISGAKDDPIKTRIDSMEHMGLYSHILEKDMGQYHSQHKNKFFETNRPRDTAFHLYGVAGPTATDHQDQFSMGREKSAYIDQPKHPNFDLGIQTNYKQLDQLAAAQREKLTHIEGPLCGQGYRPAM